MKITVNRCLRKPGLLDGARSFYLELNDNGLYIINLGRSTIAVPQSADIISQAIANKALDIIQNKFEKRIRETELRIENGELKSLAQEKHSCFLTPDKIEDFNFVNLSDGSVQISIKGEKIKMKLYAHVSYQRIIQSIKESLGK